MGDEAPIILLVDEIHQDGLIGVTNDIKKILHNISLIEGLEHDISVYFLSLQVNVDILRQVGRFICHTHINKDESDGLMGFLDFRLHSEFDWIPTAEEYSKLNPNVDFMAVFRDAQSDFLSGLDPYDLSLRPL
jgi:hypothetical protein